MFEGLLKEIEATEEERRPTPGQAAAVSTPAILQCGELLKEIEPAKTQHDAHTGDGTSSKQATTPTARQAVHVSTPVKHTRRRALASTPPPHPGPLTDGQCAFLYSVLIGGRVERGTLVSKDLKTEPEAYALLRKRFPWLTVQ